jgi:hypothetical protein
VRTRSVFLVVFLLAVQAAFSGPSVAAVHSKAHKPALLRVAPADEYFGRLKMSILGIRNQLHDLDMKLQFTPEKSEDVIGAAAMVEDAMHDWERKYPADPWLAKDVFQLAVMYARIHTEHGREVASHAMHWLLDRYGKSPYAHQARTQLGAI